MTLRQVGSDQHYGYIGFGAVTASGANTFSATIVDSIIEPDIIIKSSSSRRSRILEMDIDDILIWDVKEWHAKTSGVPDIVGGEDVIQTCSGGITADNTSEGTQAPTSDAIAQGARPGGSGAAVVGAAAGGPGTRTNGDEQPTRYVERFDFWNFGNEENAAGDVNIPFRNHIVKPNSAYEVEGNTAHYLLTAAHYHMWTSAQSIQVVENFELGAYVRRMSIDIDEMMFDRAVLISILDALVLTN